MNTMNPLAPGDAAKPGATESADREIPQLVTKRKATRVFRLAIVGGMLVMIVAGSLGAATFMQRMKERKIDQAAAQVKSKSTTDDDTAPDFDSMKRRIKTDEAAATPTPAHQAVGGLQPPAAALEAADPNGGAGPNFTDAKNGGGGAGGSAPNNYGGAGQPQKPAQPRPETPRQRQLSSDLLVVGGAKDSDMVRGIAPGLAPQFSELSGSLGSAQRTTALGEQLKSTEIRPVAASRFNNLDLMLLAGTSIPCGQQTYIVSTNPGQAMCVVSKDVYSSNGATRLIERGSQVLGERLQPMQLGHEVMPVLWDRIVTPPPYNVVIDIASLATDSLGASGLPVYVDNHFRERFGAAIMLSLISDAGQAAVNAANNNGGNTIRLTTTAGIGPDLAGKALDKTINIPPTGYSLQGSAINIFLARDVDFGRVYELTRY